MKRFLLALLAALTLTAVCTPCVCAYDIASEQAEAFGTAALESALPAQTYDAFGTLTVADAAHPRPLLQKLWGYVRVRAGERWPRLRAMRRCCLQSCFWRRCARRCRQAVRAPRSRR